MKRSLRPDISDKALVIGALVLVAFLVLLRLAFGHYLDGSRGNGSDGSNSGSKLSAGQADKEDDEEVRLVAEPPASDD